MPIFDLKYDKNIDNNNRRMTAVELSDSDLEFINLYSVWKGRSFSAIHRDAISAWVTNNPVTCTEMITGLVHTAQRYWYCHRKNGDKITFKRFTDNLTIELHKKKIPMKYIDHIKSLLKEE